MYQTVFVSVVGVILVIKVVFLIASIWFTLKYENQDRRRDSIVSLATTLSFDSFDQQSNSSLGESDGSSEENKIENFRVHQRGRFGEYRGGIFGEHSRANYGHSSHTIFMEPGPESIESYTSTSFGELKIGRFEENNATSARNIEISDQPNRSNRKVTFFDEIMHTESAPNSNPFYEDSFV